MIFIIPFSLIAACSSDNSSTPASQTSEISTSITTISGKLNSMAGMIQGTSSSSLSFAPEYVGERATGLSTIWEDTNSKVASLFNGSTYVLKQWFIDQFDESFQNSNGAKVTFVGRMANTLDILCYLGNAGVSTGSDNLPPVGTYNLVISAAMNTACGGGASDDMVGQTVVVTSEATTDTTYYDKKLSFQLPNDTSNQCPFVYYARMNSTALNLATAENQNCDGRNHASRSVFHLNKATDEALFVYFSKNFDAAANSGFEMYRGYINTTAADAKIIGFYGGINGVTTPFTSGIGFTAAGSPDDSGDVALSVLSISNAELADGTYEGCVTKSDLSVTDAFPNCGKTGVSIGTASSGAFQTAIDDEFDVFTNINQVLAVGETTTPGFTNTTDMFQ